MDLKRLLIPPLIGHRNKWREKMKHFIHKKQNGDTIECYGTIEWDSNFSVVCDVEEYDGIVSDIDTEKYNTWKKVCNFLIKNYREDIVEIESC